MFRSATSSLRRSALAAVCRPLLAGLLVVVLAAPAAYAQSRIQPSAAAQMAELFAAKQARTPTQAKLSSNLLFALDADRGAAYLDRLPRLRNALELAPDGRVLVDLEGTVSAGLRERVAELGGTVVNDHPRWGAMRALMPLEKLEALAASPAVRTIRTADRYMTQMINVTEGDVAHGANDARAQFGIDGSGVSVGAMSDSVESLVDLQNSGDLPPGVTVLPGQSGAGTSEGTALLEIIHDMAPGADLFFATGQGGQAQMAQNILDLAAAGCRVITDDVLYFAEPVFQDGIIADAVDTVFGQGVTYFSSAGNSGNLDSGTAGVFEGLYTPTALPAPLAGNGLSAHDFGSGDNSNEVTSDGPFFFTLQWADLQDMSDNDYDLFLLDAAQANVLGASTNTQNGTQDPFEFLDTIAPDDTGNHLVVVLFNGDPSVLHLNSHRGELEHATDGQIFGHPAAAGAIAVAAVNVAEAAAAGGSGRSKGLPEFDGDESFEPFTSDGPRDLFPEGFEDPGMTLPTTRQKPDVTAADGVSTATPGFNPFFGTSASAPHAAGISALFAELFPSVSSADAYDAFRSSALDIDPFGFDRNSGFGIIKAQNALEPPNMIFVDGFESGDTSSWQ